MGPKSRIIKIVIILSGALAFMTSSAPSGQGMGLTRVTKTGLDCGEAPDSASDRQWSRSSGEKPIESELEALGGIRRRTAGGCLYMAG